MRCSIGGIPPLVWLRRLAALVSGRCRESEDEEVVSDVGGRNPSLNSARQLQSEEVAADLFCEFGYSQTSVAKILAALNISRGALYHQFPGGKDELAAAAVAVVSRRLIEHLQAAYSKSTSTEGLVVRLFEEIANFLVATEFVRGCSLGPLSIELAAKSGVARDAALDATRGWQSKLEQSFLAKGEDEAGASMLAQLVCVAIEGGVAMCRLQKTDKPIRVLGEMLSEVAAVGFNKVR